MSADQPLAAAAAVAVDLAADPSVWTAMGSGESQIELSGAAPRRIPALQMKFDFKGGKGFVVARRAVQRTMPEEYAVRFRLRGKGPVNDLELKLVDLTGLNVWRYVIKNRALPARWTLMRLDSRQFEFAWGPAGGGALAVLGSVEVAIVAGQGGAGTLEIGDLSIEDRTPAATPVASASSESPGFEAARALGAAGWRPRPEDARPWLQLDSAEPRHIGGVIIDWLETAPAGGFRVRGSKTGGRWRTLHHARHAGGKRSYVFLPDTTFRSLRLELSDASAGAALRLQPFEFGRSIDAFWHCVAPAEDRGWHPRWLHREQSYWTPIGTANATRCALINDDGMIEIIPGSFSIEPMLWIRGRLITWTDAASSVELRQGFLPVPSVIWESLEWSLRIEVEASISNRLRIRYRLDNRTSMPITARLFVVVRPFQVTPPWQHYRNLGGVSSVHELAWRDDAVIVDGKARISPVHSAATFGAMSFDEGFIAAILQRGELPPRTRVHDPFGFACGALRFDLVVPAGGSAQAGLDCTPQSAAAAADDPAFDWPAKLPTGQWRGQGWIGAAIEAALSATSHVLITRSGAALQPGPRRYTRSWIRDGAMMAAALLRMGCVDEVAEFIRWYATFQRADGFVPCCVDGDGPDWLVEHDSHGQLIALIADHQRFAADDASLQQSWSAVEKAVGCIERLLDASGLLPISVSHEGYLAQPVHSYWDDFWALRGLTDAVYLANATDRDELAAAWEALRCRFAATLFASIESTRAAKQLDFIPGSIEWADFDPTATANAIYLLDVPAGLNRSAVERTFDLYLADWRRKRSGAVNWINYTPYEIRIIGALVRLGRRGQALELLQFFLQDRRPLAWNQWPEIAWRDPKAPAHLGDLPHTWIAAEYVLAVRSLFGYEREADRALVLAAGLAAEWIQGAGVHVEAMPTAYGKLTYSLSQQSPQTLRFEIGPGIDAKIVLRPPIAAALVGVRIDGVNCTTFDEESVTLQHAPDARAEIICTIR